MQLCPVFTHSNNCSHTVVNTPAQTSFYSLQAPFFFGSSLAVIDGAGMYFVHGEVITTGKACSSGCLISRDLIIEPCVSRRIMFTI